MRKITNQRWNDAMHAAQEVLQCVVTSVVSGATHCVENNQSAIVWATKGTDDRDAEWIDRPKDFFFVECRQT